MSEKNGSPLFNFRKRGYNDEIRLSRLRIEIDRLGRKIDALDLTEDVSPLLDELTAMERESLSIMFGIVEYLPDDYLQEGITSEQVDYSSIDSIIDSMRYGSADLLAQKLSEARRELTKNSLAPSN